MAGWNPLARLRSGLFGDHNFRMLWGAATVSAFGFYITDVTVPLLAIEELNATSFEVGLIKVVEQAPALLFGLFLGVLVDRTRKRQLLILSDIVRSFALISVPIAYAFGHLSLALLLAVVFIVGTFNLLFDVADGSFIPVVLGRDRLVEGNSKIEASYASAQLAGPAIGGALVSLLTAPYTLLVTAITLFSSASLIRRMKVEEHPVVVENRPAVMHEINEGLRYFWGNALMRPVILAGAGQNFFGFMFMAVYILYMKRELDLTDFQVGLVFAFGGLGSLIGTLVTPRLNDVFGIGPVLVAGNLLFGLTGMLIPLAVLAPAWALWLVLAAEFLQYMCYMPFFLNGLTTVQLQSPDSMRGRIMSTRKFLTWGVQPFGSLAGGILGTVISLVATLALAEFGMLAVGILLLLNPIRSMRSVPHLEDEAVLTAPA
jgi:MFS family permease